MQKTSKILPLALCLIAPLPLLAGPLEDGQVAYEQKNYTLAFQKWEPLAKAGNAEAQYEVGLLYMKGHGVTRSDQQAVRLVSQSGRTRLCAGST